MMDEKQRQIKKERKRKKRDTIEIGGVAL